MEPKYCVGCKKRLIVIPFLGDKVFHFEDGVYCELCAKKLIERRRRNL